MTSSSRRVPSSRKIGRRLPPAVDIVVDSALWRSRRNAKTLLQRAIAEAASAVSASGGEVAVLLTDDTAIRALNRNWRRKDAATNVLSFPMMENLSQPAAAGKRRTRIRGAGTLNAKTRNAPIRRKPCLLGDIVIAYETTEREARAERKPFAHHLAHLAVHGFLHLVGYDHAGDREAEAMEGLETAILARMGVPDPYVAR
jgi:probable rRNA maturation factor